MRRRAPTVVDITALIDVVFQLLIFFLLTSTYVSQEGQQAPQVAVDLPESSRSADQSKFEDLTVTIDRTGKLFISKDEVSLDELGIRFTRTKDLQPQTIVLIRGDQNVPYGRIAQVMELARIARLKISVVLGGE